MAQLPNDGTAATPGPAVGAQSEPVIRFLETGELAELSEQGERLIEVLRAARRSASEPGPSQGQFSYEDDAARDDATEAIRKHLAAGDGQAVAVLSRQGNGALVRGDLLDPFALGPERYAVAQDGSWVLANPAPGELAIVGSLVNGLELPAPTSDDNRPTR